MQSATGWSGTKGGLDMNKVITISRQYGSGGREVGQKLAEHYGIPFYDNELITRAAKEMASSLVATDYKVCKSGGQSDQQLVLFPCYGDQCVWQSGFWLFGLKSG